MFFCKVQCTVYLLLYTSIVPLAFTSPLPVCDIGNTTVEFIIAEFVRLELVSVTGGEVGGIGIPANESDVLIYHATKHMEMKLPSVSMHTYIHTHNS